MPVHNCTYLNGNRVFQVVALNNLLTLVMVNNVFNTARERQGAGEYKLQHTGYKRQSP